MRSWSSCRFPPRLTASIMMFSEAMKGSSSRMCFSMTLAMHHQAGRHVLIDVQNGVHSQKCLGDGQTLVGGIVQGALKPLGGGGDLRDS